jgi:hypothetical protein
VSQEPPVPSPVPSFLVARVEHLLGRVPLFACFVDENETSTIPHKYRSLQKDVVE